jgi:hypothetical protein
MFARIIIRGRIIVSWERTGLKLMQLAGATNGELRKLFKLFARGAIWTNAPVENPPAYRRYGQSRSLLVCYPDKK